MLQGIPRGSFHLRPGVELLPSGEGGVVVQFNPMRAIRVNRTAYQVLNTAKTGLTLHGVDAAGNRQDQGTMRFIDSLCQAEILEWKPPEDLFEPLVSIVIPVYNRSRDIAECLNSLAALNYPKDKREIIVVDDASTDQTPEVVRRFDVRMISLARNSGPSAARNAGVQRASGDIIAFIDSDCIADPAWLRDLLPYFHDPRITVVGGYVDACYRKSLLDRYEITHSALNMGTKSVIGASSKSAFYVPTCNLLVRKTALLEVGGLDESLRLGEDVDLCWKFMAKGYRHIYVPKGRVLHKHPNHFWQNFKRRFDYGTSEAVLYLRYPRVTKRFPWQLGGLAMLIVALYGLLALSLTALPALAVIPLFESLYRKWQVKKKLGLSLSWNRIFQATLRSHGLFVYYLSYYLVRYYLLPAIAFMLLVPRLAPVTVVLFLYPTLFEYIAKKSRLRFPFFLFFFWAEHAFYQAGVFWGCIKQKGFRLYRISFVRAGF